MKYSSSNWELSICPLCDGLNFKVKQKKCPDRRLPVVELECTNCGAKFEIRPISAGENLGDTVNGISRIKAVLEEL